MQRNMFMLRVDEKCCTWRPGLTVKIEGGLNSWGVSFPKKPNKRGVLITGGRKCAKYGRISFGAVSILRNFLDVLGVKSDYLLPSQSIREDKT